VISQIYKMLSTPVKKLLFWLASRKKIGPTQKTIHIVRLDTIGDFVLFSAILPYFRKVYSGYKIVLIVDSVVAQMAMWLNRNNYFDELIAIDGKQYNRNFLYYYNTLKKIRANAPEVVIQPTFSRTQKSDEVVFISKEAQKIGYEGDMSNISPTSKARNNAKYDRLIKNPTVILEPEINRHFLNELAGREILASGVPAWEISESEQVIAKKRLESLGIDVSKPLVAICPGSSRSAKNWPVEKFISLIAALHGSEPSLQFVVIGGERDWEVCLRVVTHQSIKSLPVFNLCGKTKLSELAGVLALARLYIGNNTGSLHISSAVGISTIALDGKEHYLRFFPYPAWKQGSKNISLTNEAGPALSVKDIAVQKVYDNAREVLHTIL